MDILGKKRTAARFSPPKMIWFARAELPRVLPPKTHRCHVFITIITIIIIIIIIIIVININIIILFFFESKYFFAIGKSSSLLAESKGFLYYSLSCYSNLASLLQLEKERKDREERQKRDAEEAAERQRREEEWVRTNHWQLIRAHIRARDTCQR